MALSPAVIATCLALLPVRLTWEAVLLVLGAWWCKSAADRFGSDVEVLQTSTSNLRRGFTILTWLVTLAVAGGMVVIVWRIFAKVADLLG